MENRKFMRINGITPHYFDFYNFCKGIGVPCITIQQKGSRFHINIDHSSMGISKTKEKSLELSYVLTEYITKLDDVITFSRGLDFAYVEVVVLGMEEEIASNLMDDYVRIFEIKF